MPLPTFSSVVYLSPWLPLPPGWSKVGLDVLVLGSGAPSGNVLAGRLRQGAATVQVVVATVAIEVVIVPAAPLSAMLDYYVDVMWVAAGTPPANVNWGASGPSTNYATAPVVTAIATLQQGAVAGAAVQLGWSFAAAALTPAGANLSAYNSSGASVGFQRVQGVSGTLPLKSGANFGSQLYLQAVMPISGTPGAGFAAPFSLGPIVAGLPLPLAAPAIVSAAYDRAQVQVGWTPPANLPATGGSIGYDLVVSPAGTPGAAAIFQAAADGGMAALGGGGMSQTLQVAGRMRIGVLVGAPGTAVALLPLAPTIDQIAVAGTIVTARVTFPSGSPSGAQAAVTLNQNGVVKASSSASASGAVVSLNGFVTGTVGWTVSGAMVNGGSVALSGPPSAPVAVLGAAPVIADVAMVPAMSGGVWTVTLTAAAPPPPGTAYSVAIQQNNVAVGSQTIGNATAASFTLAQGATPANGVIDGAAVAQVTLNIVGAAAISPPATASFIASAAAAQGGTAPVISTVQNIGPSDPSGVAEGLQIDVAAAVSGKSLTVRLHGNGGVVATASAAAGDTHVNLPLSQPLDPAIRWQVDARWTGGGVDAATFGGWSAPVAVMTASTSVIAADFDAGTLTLEIQPPSGGTAQGAYLYAHATGQAIAGTNVIGTRGSFALTPGSASWQAAAKPFLPLPAAAGSRSLAPSSALVPLLLQAPALSAVGYDGTTLSASWSVVQDTAANAATGALLRVGNANGTIATAAAGSASGEIAVQLPAAQQGQVTLAVRATRSAGATTASGAYSAAVAPLVAAPVVGTVALNAAGTTVTAAVTPPAGVPFGTTCTAWLYAGGKVVGGPASGTSPSFDYVAAGVTGLSIVAQAGATVSGVALTGPLSVPAPVLAFAPGLVAVTVTSADADHWQLTAEWTPPADGAAIVTYWLRLASGVNEAWKNSYGANLSGSVTFPKMGIVTNAAYTLQLWAVSANGSTTPVAATDFWFVDGAFTSVAAGPAQVNAQWSAPAGVTGATYRLRLIDTATSAVLASTTSAATSTGLDIAGLGLNPAGRYALALAVQAGPVLFDPGGDGTAATRPAVLLARPVGLTVATAASTGIATLSWQAVTPPAGYTTAYQISFSNGAAPVSVSGTSHAFTSALAAGADLSVTVTAVISKNNVTSAGPASAPLAIPSAAPALTAADYDGVNVTAAWTPVTGAASYVATVLNAAGGGAGTSPSVAGTTVTFADALTAADGPFTVVVQAASEAGTGLPSAPLPLFRTGWFVSTAAPSAQPPHIYPAAAMTLEPTKIEIYLPALANQAITVAPVGPFALTTNPDATTAAALPYILTFTAASDVWNFGSTATPVPAIRPQLQADYIAFLQAAETAHAASWGIAALQLAISRWMPQTFAEMHYYAYGLNLTGGPGTGAIDLKPGLVLRVGFADYTNVWSGDSNSWLNGFGGGSPSDFDVADSMSGAGDWQISMDSFTARLIAAGAMTVSPPSSVTTASAAAGVADAADLFFPGFPNPFYRLFFPSQLQNPTSPGSVQTGANFALASAASYTALSNTSPTLGANAPLAYFRGRAVLRVMIRVRVNDMELVVPLGTTLGNVLDRYGVRPPATALQFTGISLERGAGPSLAVFGGGPAPALAYDAAARHPVRLDWATMAAYGGPYDATSLPLLHGDRISF